MFLVVLIRIGLIRGLYLLKINISPEDIQTLAAIDQLGVVPSELVGFDFADTAVVKPWGYEYLVHESDDKSICAWVLHLNDNGAGTSFHCHHTKKTRILVLEGEVLIKTIHKEMRLPENNEIIIDQATFHSLEALSENTVLVEIESPSNKPDAVRWKDHWGRDRQEYESQCELVETDTVSCPYKTEDALREHIVNLVKETVFVFLD